MSEYRYSGLLMPLVLAGAVAGCNMITGADDIRLVQILKKNSSASGDPTGGQGPGGATASGWGGSGAGVATGGYGGSASSSSGEPPPPPCEYPAGPYGNELYDTVPPYFSWNGHPEGPVGQVASISMEDYLDCDGSRGIHAVMVETSQYG